jgi:bifunctional UDP-N-acetylglucosamine pyrophosphorylase/glucosamine-1-phosphate N-acetyltransferase
MQTVLLAGGAGKRVFPLSANQPKPMFKVVGKPLVEHAIEILKEAGLKDFVVVIGPNGASIKDYLGDGKRFGVNVDYAFQKKPLGMANALESALSRLDADFFVVNADDIFESRLITEMMAKFRMGDSEILLACKPVKETWKFGVIRKEGDRVNLLVEKPPKGTEPSKLAVIGVYVLSKAIFNYYKRLAVSDHQYEDAIQAFIQDKHVVRAVSYDGFFAGYKHPWDLFNINQHLMDKLITNRIVEDEVEISDRAEISGNVWLCKGVKVFGGACVNGPVYVGPGSVIGNNALVRNYASLGAGCTVGFSTEVKRSIIGDNCLFHMNFIGDSIISDNCMFGAGSITANFRFDEKAVSTTIEGKKVSSGERKLGAIVGEKSKMGVNSILAPGVKLGPNSIVGPGVALQHDLPPKMAIFLRKEDSVIRPNKQPSDD